MTRAPKRVTSLAGLAVERSLRESGTLDAVPVAVFEKTLFTQGNTRKEAP